MIQRIQDALLEAKRGPWIFLFSTFLLGISINLLTNLIDGLREDQDWCRPWWWWALVALGPLLFLFFTSGLLNTLLSGDLGETSVSMAPAVKSKGLVVLVSPKQGSESAEQAIQHHSDALQQVWLVYSRGGIVSSEEDAQRIRKNLLDQGFRPDQVREIPLETSDFQNPEEVKKAIEKQVYSDLPTGLKEDDVIIDITGGRKTTTAGALLAGLPKGRRIEINEPASINIRGQATKAGTPIEITIDYKLKRLRSR